jgi:D-3-phosphoglycerate dehydrogenase
MANSVKPKVLITDGINAQAVAILEANCDVTFQAKISHAELLEQIGGFDALMIRSASTVSADILEKAGRLRIVGRAGVGTDNVDVSVATKKGVIVINSPEGNTVAASEHTVGMLLALARHIPQGDASLKAGQWIRSQLVGVEVYGKTLGIVGLGKIGRRVAKTCLTLGMKVNVFDPFLSKAAAEELGVLTVSFDDILEQSDFISIHAPKTKETQNLFNAQAFTRCKKGLRIVNCARGGIIDETALLNALRAGQIAGAALDVYTQEPLPAESPLLSATDLADRLVLTPHLGASTEEAQINVALDVAGQIRDFFATGIVKSAVNIPMLRPELLEPIKDYMLMAEVLGNFVRQAAKGASQSVEITVKGEFLAGQRTEPLSLAILKGILSTAHESVNYVNAPAIAEENGIQVTQGSTRKAGNYLNLIEVKLTTERRTYAIAGTLISDKLFRIVSLDDYAMALEPTEHILLTPHKDQPGMIARVATVLGEAGVNISAMEVARKGSAAGGESVMVFNLDNPLPEDALQAIEQIDGIFGSRAIHLIF